MTSRARASLLGVPLLLCAAVLAVVPARAAGETLSPASPRFSYDAGPFTNANVGGLLLGSCDAPEGCDEHEFTVSIPAGYYEGLRRQGRTGVVQVALSWEDVANDFDLVLANADGDPIATSGFGNSDFERINFTELPSGTYTVQVTIFRVVNASFHVDVSLQSFVSTPTVSQADAGGMTFGNATPVTLERSSGEPDIDIAPNDDVYVNFPLGAGTNSILFKSTDDGNTFKPLGALHPNNNPLPANILGGGDSYIAIDPTGRFCFSELNTLLSLGIGCSNDGGKTFPVADALAIDPQTPLVDRQWQAATPQGEQFLSAQYGIVDGEVSHPGIRLFKEVANGTSLFEMIQEIDTGRSMKSYNMVADPTDTDANGGTIVNAYLRSNQGADKLAKPHELMVWQSTDGGETITTHRVAALPTTPGNNFASVDIDRQGNVYVAWSEQGTWDIFYSIARKGHLDSWSKPVRVNADPRARTAIQPTIKVGDRGRVYVGYYGAEQYGNPDNLTNGVWNAYVAWSANGACMLDASPCAAPAFHQAQVTNHPVQHRGICLGGTGCGGDPYYGDRSMLEFLDIAFSPSTGQAHVVVTDSSRTNGGTTITLYHQLAGPSAYAGKPAISVPSRVGSSVSDASGDAGWPYESPPPMAATPGADILSVAVSRAGANFKIVMTVADASAFLDALQAGAGTELLIGTRFASELDVIWAGMRFAGREPEFVAGHMGGGLLVDTYVPDADIPVTGSVDEASGRITMEVPVSALKTQLQRPEGQDGPFVPAFASATMPAYSVTGFSFAGVTTIDDDVAKHLLDVTPSFTLGKPPAAVKGSRQQQTAPRKPLASTGADGLAIAFVLLAAAALVARRLRVLS